MKSRLQEPPREPKSPHRIVPRLHSVKLAQKLAGFGLAATVPATLQVGFKATRRIDGHNANSWVAAPRCTCPFLYFRLVQVSSLYRLNKQGTKTNRAQLQTGCKEVLCSCRRARTHSLCGSHWLSAGWLQLADRRQTNLGCRLTHGRQACE